MKLILIKHGETEEGKKGIILGSLPGTLTEKGKKDAKKIAKNLKKSGLIFDGIMTSDLERAKDTAEIIGKELKLQVKTNKLLRERKAGIAEGKTEKEINWEEYEKQPLLKRKHKRGESFSDVKERAKKFIESIKRFRNGDIIIVSHDVFIKMLLSASLNYSVKKSLSEDIRNKAIIIDTEKKKKAEIIPLL
ncbi:MAG: histidine phosphatase family protein [Candidatus Paceibacterota bacterium]